MADPRGLTRADMLCVSMLFSDAHNSPPAEHAGTPQSIGSDHALDAPAHDDTHTPNTPYHHDTHPLASAVRTVSGLTLLSRFAGLGRDLINARLLGDTAIGSAFMAAWAIPNLFRRLFGEGALAAAFIPEYTQLTKREPETADRFATLTMSWLALITGGLLVLGEAICLAVLLNSPSSNADRLLSVRLIMVMLPFMPVVCISAILGGMLQTHGRFAPTAAAPIILNAMIIAVALPFYLLAPQSRVLAAYWIGVAAVVAGLLQVGWSLLALRGRVQWKRGFAQAREPMGRLLKRFVPVVIGMGTIQINAFLDTLIAMWPLWVGPTIMGMTYPLTDHSNSILSFTQRLYQFPLGVFGIAVATAIFPLLSRHADDRARFHATLARGLRLSFFIGLPATVGLILVRKDLTFIMYSGGRSAFSHDGAARAALVLLGYAPGVWAYSLNHVLTRAFYASGDMRTPMRVGLWMVLVNLMLNLTLIWPLHEAGLALSTSLSAVLQLCILSRLLKSILQRTHAPTISHASTASNQAGAEAHPILDIPTRKGFGQTILSTLGMTMLVVLVSLVLGLPGEPTSWLGALGSLLLMVSMGGAGYFGMAILLKQEELHWLIARKTPHNPLP